MLWFWKSLIRRKDIYILLFPLFNYTLPILWYIKGNWLHLQFGKMLTCPLIILLLWEVSRRVITTQITTRCISCSERKKEQKEWKTTGIYTLVTILGNVFYLKCHENKSFWLNLDFPLCILYMQRKKSFLKELPKEMLQNKSCSRCK